MRFEAKWKWFKRFIRLIAFVAGCLAALSILRKDFALLVASISLGVGAGSYFVMIGFIDALFEEAEP